MPSYLMNLVVVVCMFLWALIHVDSLLNPKQYSQKFYWIAKCIYTTIQEQHGDLFNMSRTTAYCLQSKKLHDFVRCDSIIMGALVRNRKFWHVHKWFAYAADVGIQMIITGHIYICRNCKWAQDGVWIFRKVNLLYFMTQHYP